MSSALCILSNGSITKMQNMRNSEKLCLQWNDFKENIGTFFGELRVDRELTDVTLACGDGKQVEAHKAILAASSPFFMNLFKRNTHTHLLIFMRGLKSDDLMAIMDFLYLGEANVFQESLEPFLALAEELQLKGLTGTSESAKGEEQEVLSMKREVPNNKETPVEQNITVNSSIEYPMSQLNQATDSNRSMAVSSDLEDLDSQIRSMITKSDVSAGNGQGRMATCNVCGDRRPLKAMPRHIEASHITGVSHSCEPCGKTFRSRYALSRHKC